MVEGETLNQLIERLHQLHLEQETILRALEDIAQQDIIVEQEPRAIVSNVVSNVIPNVAASAAPTAVPVPQEPTVAAFHIGQRVYITNRITHVPLLRRATEGDRTAIVTHFTPSRVAIRTINGHHTHRHPKNLRPL
jgi:hypothetical protein